MSRPDLVVPARGFVKSSLSRPLIYSPLHVYARLAKGLGRRARCELAFPHEPAAPRKKSAF